jgi:DNA-binding NarL/FixJ family response regulator
MSVNIFSDATRSSGTSESPLEPSSLWSALIAGKARIVESGATETSHYLHLHAVNDFQPANGLSHGRIDIFERVLFGTSPKVVAAELGCSSSTVATAVAFCMRSMGFTCKRIPPLLVVLTRALRSQPQRLHLNIERVAHHDGERQLVTSARLERHLSPSLSVGELAVISMVVEGESHAEIARRRRTSVRTVANQIASVYKKLGVSGRMDLLQHMAARRECAA